MAAPLPPHRGAGARGLAQLPPLLRQQLLALVHRAALLSRLRELGLGAGAAAEAPPLPGLAAGPIARLEMLLHSDGATASQVLAEVDDLLDEAAAAGGAAGAKASSGEPPPRGASSSSTGRRRSRRRQQEREAAAAAQASAQAGVDWTLLERNRSLWHAEHAGPGLYHRLHRRRERQQQRQAAAGAPLAAPSPQSLPAAAQQELVLASALLQQSSEEEERGVRRLGSRAAGGGASSSSPRSSTRSHSSGSLAAAGAACGPAAAAGEAEQQAEQQLAASGSSSQADSALCPICLDLPADVAMLPCRHRACLGCCARLAAWCPNSSSAVFGLPTSGPLCPLCRTGIDSFTKTA